MARATAMIAAIYARKSTENGVSEKPYRGGCFRALMCLAVLAIGCGSPDALTSDQRETKDVASLFSRKFGDSPDAGLYKYSDIRAAWDHVATVHGMADDIGLCEDMASALTQKNPQDRYTCRLLNE